MTSRRLLKAAEAIREVVSMAILTELRDPRVQNVTVTAVEVAPDMRTAKVMVSVMGTEGQQHLCLSGLRRSAGFLQSKLAKRIDTRYTPRLSFELDEGIKKSLEMARLLHQLEQERQLLAEQQREDNPTDEASVPPAEGPTAKGSEASGSAASGSTAETPTVDSSEDDLPPDDQPADDRVGHT